MLTMKAARFYEPHQPLRVESVPVPEIGPDELLVAVRACGMCGSDVHFWEGSLPLARTPLILGHEPAGVATRVGEAVQGWSEGDRVAVKGGLSCGACDFCRSGRHVLCAQAQVLGVHTDGAFAEYLKVKPAMLMRLPDHVPFEQGAIISDALATPFHALTGRGHLAPGESVAVFGCGGLGIHAVQIARLCGASKIIAVDIRPAALERARRVGADIVIDASREEPYPRILELTGGVDLAVECIGQAETVRQAARSLRRGGRAVVVGLGPERLQLFQVNMLAFWEISLIGSFGSAGDECERLLALVASGRLDLSESISVRLPLAEVNRGLEILRDKVDDPVRVIIEPAA